VASMGRPDGLGSGAADERPRCMGGTPVTPARRRPVHPVRRVLRRRSTVPQGGGQVGRIGTVPTVVAARGGEDDPGVVFAGRGQARTIRSKSRAFSVTTARPSRVAAQQLAVVEVGEGRVHGGGHDVVAVLAEASAMRWEWWTSRRSFNRRAGPAGGATRLPLHRPRPCWRRGRGRSRR